MTTLIPAVNNQPKIIDAEFIKLTIEKAAGGTEEYTFSSAYKDEYIAGTKYLAAGGFLKVSTQQRSMESTSYDTNIELAGIDQAYIYLALSPTYKLKGSTVEIYRGFYNDAYILDSVSLRFTGVINNFTITENEDDRSITYSVVLTCSNFKTILENRRAGRYTNKASWQKFAPTDKSMNRIETLHNKSFDFGRETDTYK